MRFVINGVEITISETVLNNILVILLLCILAIVVNNKIKKEKIDKAPSNFITLVGIFVDFIEGMVNTNMGEFGKKFAPFIATILSYLVVSNTISIFGVTSPTSDYSIALTLAIIVFIVIQATKFKRNNGVGGYLKSFTKPMALITPINIISDLANPISMSFRLFGNVMSGSLIIALLHGALGYFSPLITAPLHLYFDLFVGILQAYVFVMLTMIYIDEAAH